MTLLCDRVAITAKSFFLSEYIKNSSIIHDKFKCCHISLNFSPQKI